MSRSLDPGVSIGWRVLRYRYFLPICLGVLALDQATKAWIAWRLPLNTYGEEAGAIVVVRNFFYLVHLGNTGAAWSVFTGRSVALAALAAASLVAIFLCRRSLGLHEPRIQVCFGLICGGISGNLVDRLLRHHVLDFLDFHFGSYIYPSFNVADSAICFGVILYLWQSLKTPKPAVTT